MCCPTRRIELFEARLKLTHFKIVIIGDIGVGKTTLKLTFKYGDTSENFVDDCEIVSKMVQLGDENVKFQIVELHEEVTYSAECADAVILLYSDDSEVSIANAKTFWYSFANRYFTAVPIFVIKNYHHRRSGQTTDLRDIAAATHAWGKWECSFKEAAEVIAVFLEIYRIVAEHRREEQFLEYNNPLRATSLAGCLGIAVRNSGPVLRQVFVNAREIITNPAAFPDQKKFIRRILRCGFHSGDSQSSEKEEYTSIKEEESDYFCSSSQEEDEEDEQQ